MMPSMDCYCSEKEFAGTFENQILYRMCQDYPDHEHTYVTAGKVIAIGRIYAASPERGAGTARSEGALLSYEIGEQIKQSGLDEMLAGVDINCRISNERVLQLIVEIHNCLVDSIETATRNWSVHSEDEDWMPRRQVSFASKYLHFHRPNAFPIMDSFAKAGLNCAGQRGAFRSYKSFCEAFVLHTQNSSEGWTPRGIDTDLVRRGRAHKSKKTDTCACCGHTRKKIRKAVTG